jgi:Flp pilus assembly protein TadG
MDRKRERGPERGRDRGAGVVEFALIMPLLLMLIFGVIQFGTLFNRQQGVHAAAREAARVAALPSSTLTDIQTRANDALKGLTFSTPPLISVTPVTAKPCESRQGETVVVTVQAPMTIEIPVWGSKNVTLTGRGEFRCE